MCCMSKQCYNSLLTPYSHRTNITWGFLVIYNKCDGFPAIFMPCNSTMSVICKIKITPQNTGYILRSYDDIIPVQISISVIWGCISLNHLSFICMKYDRGSQHDEQQSTVVLPDRLFWRFKNDLMTERVLSDERLSYSSIATGHRSLDLNDLQMWIYAGKAESDPIKL